MDWIVNDLMNDFNHINKSLPELVLTCQLACFGWLKKWKVLKCVFWCKLRALNYKAEEEVI